MGADRVLICADAITEDAYLQALAASLGTSYDRLDTLTTGRRSAQRQRLDPCGDGRIDADA